MTSNSHEHPENDGTPPFRYSAALAGRIELEWQQRWEKEGTFYAANPTGNLAGLAGPKRSFVMDMFPYPSGSGLHVGHPLGFIATDIYARFMRMNGHNVLYTMGYDAFGLPAEQHAIQTGTHPRVTTEANIERYRDQLRSLGMSYDYRRSITTIEPDYYRWTQWLFLQIFNSWYDPELDRARPIDTLVEQFERGERAVPGGQAWAELSPLDKDEVLSEYRLAYSKEAPVNWCPGLGTVLSNEEVTADGRSERGNFPVFRTRLRQWMMRITAYGNRLLDDLEGLDWPEAIKLQQRNWIGRSEGARVEFAVDGVERSIDVFTTRPDTLFGATYLVLAPEHDMVDELVTATWPEQSSLPETWTGGYATPAEAVAAYRRQAASRSELERMAEDRAKTGVFVGKYARNPVNGELLPIFVADYVLMGYGTGAIMAVPAHDQRDFEFARAFTLPIRCVVEPKDGRGTDPAEWPDAMASHDARLVNSANTSVSLDGLTVAEAKKRITAWLTEHGPGEGMVNFRLRDWLFSRQRYWGEPFPIVYDEDGVAHALPESMLPVRLPEIDDYAPRTYDPQDLSSTPETPLSRSVGWVEVELDLGRGDGPRRYRRETNTMPNWAGSSWYQFRYIDPDNQQAMVDPANDRYWMEPTEHKPHGGVDLYVGGSEQAVLHLLYARFWQKILFDLGHVSSDEPFHRLYNQGMVTAHVYRDSRGFPVPAAEVEERDGGWYWKGERVSREAGKMGKSLRNAVSPDEIREEYGADTLRLYEMATGPLDASRPWDSRAIVGSHRFLQRLWRTIVDEHTGDLVVTDEEPDTETLRALHRAINGIAADLSGLRFNTAVAKAIELVNFLVKRGSTPRTVAEQAVLLVAPLAPHIAEEMWQRLGYPTSLARQPFPVADPAYLRQPTVTCVVQIRGKVKARLEVAPEIGEDELRSLALAEAAVVSSLGDAEVRKVVVRAPKLVNIVI
ncbi:leucine--tRNA ligase [Micromonospora sp. NPDC049107]|uniref:leucine--tRNA ligase n=1 Tax=Micromonospora sp. NPDC049107 TaxID=3154349 RepID=UPI0033DBB7A5